MPITPINPDEFFAHQTPIDEQDKINNWLKTQTTPLTDAAKAQSILYGQMTEPVMAEEYGYAHNIGKQLGLPAEVILPQHRNYANQLNYIRYINTIQDDATFERWIAENPNYAPLTSDDFNNLDWTGKLIRTLDEGTFGTLRANAQARQRLYEGFSPELLKERNIDPNDLPSGAWQALQAPLAMATGLLDDFIGAAPEIIAGGIAGSVVPGIGSVAGAAAGAIIGMARRQAETSMGETLLRLDQAEQATGKKFTDDERLLASVITGGLSFGIGMIGNKIVTEEANKLITSVVTDRIADMMAKRSVTNVITNTINEAAKSGAKGAAFSVALSGSIIAGEQFAKTIGDDWQNVLNDPEEQRRVAEELAFAAISGGLLFAGMRGTAGTVEAFKDLSKIRQAEKDAAVLGELVKTAENSKTFQRDRDVFASFVQSQAQGKEIEEIGIPALTIQKLYDTLSISPQRDDGVFGFIPDIDKILQDALAVDGDIYIKTSDYIKHFVGTKIHDTLKNDIRIREDGLTLNESKEVFAERIKLLKAVKDNTLEIGETFFAKEESVKKLFDDAYAKAINAGEDAASAKRFASIAASYYEVRGEKLGIDPFELYNKSNITIEKGDVGQVREGLFQFSTKRAQEAQSEDLVKTKKLAGTPKEVFEQTGWFRNETKEWTFEISDKDVTFKDEGIETLKKNKSTKLGDLINHPNLFKMFPELANIPVNVQTLDRSYGRYLPSDKLIELNERFFDTSQPLSKSLTNDALTTIVHEIQHAIQDIEGRIGAEYRSLNNLQGMIIIPESQENKTKLLNAANEFLASYLGNQPTVNKLIEAEKFAILPNDKKLDKLTQVYRSLIASSNWGKASDVSNLISLYNAIIEENQAGFDYAVYALRLIEREAFSTQRRFENIEFGSPRLALLFQGERGAITFNSDSVKIILDAAKKDPTTLIHEFSHLMFKELMDDAANPDSPMFFKEQWETLSKWIGLEEGKQPSTEQLEKLARGFERYLMEGKAPTHALGEVFRNFKRWFLRVYQQLTTLDVELTDEVRAVFDHMIAFDEEIKAYKDAGFENPLFKSAKDAGMSEKEFKLYTDTIMSARAAEDVQLAAKITNYVIKLLDKDFKQRVKAGRDENLTTLKADKAINAYKWLATRKTFDGSTGIEKAKFNLADIPETVLRDLPSFMIDETNKSANIDDIAFSLGYPNAFSLLNAITTLHKDIKEVAKLSGRQDATIDWYLQRKAYLDAFNVEKANLERHSSLAPFVAMEALYNEQRIALIAKELKTLSWMASGSEGTVASHKLIPSLTKEAIEGWVTQRFMDTSVKSNLSIKRVQSLVMRKGKAAELALLKGDTKAAFKAKQEQLIGMIQLKKVTELNKVYNKFNNKAARIAKVPVSKSRDQAYTNQLHALLGALGYKVKRNIDELQRSLNGVYLGDFLQQLKDNGLEPPNADWLINGLAMQADRYSDPKNLTVAEFYDLVDLVDSLDDLGKKSQQFIQADKIKAFDDVINELVDQMSLHKQQDIPGVVRIDDLEGLEKQKAKFLAMVASGDTELTKPEFQMDWADKGNPNGPFNKYLFRPFKDAQNFSDKLRLQAIEALKKLDATMPKEWSNSLNRRVVDPDMPFINPRTGMPFKYLPKHRIISAALNLGLEDNLIKLAEGYGSTPGIIEKFIIKHMTKEDWDYVQAVWKIFEDLKEPIDNLQRRVSGIGIILEKPRTIYLPDGSTIEGKYFPLEYDSTLDTKTETRKLYNDPSAPLYDDHIARATTDRRHTIARVKGVTRPVLLDLNVASHRISAVIHDLAFREAIINADKIVANPKFREAYRNAFGDAAYKALRPWIRDIASQGKVPAAMMSKMDRFIDKARLAVVMVELGYRLPVVMIDAATTPFLGIEAVGRKYYVGALREIFKDPQHAMDKLRIIKSKSDELRFREERLDRDVVSRLQDVLTKPKWYKTVQRNAFYLNAIADQFNGAIIWEGAYRKAIDEGALEPDARFIADKTLRRTLSSSATVDLSPIMRQKGAVQLMTMFFGFWNNMYNKYKEVARTASELPSKIAKGQSIKEDVGLIVARSIYLVLIPALLDAMISRTGPDPDKEETYIGWVMQSIAMQTTGALPIIRDIVRSFISGYDPSLSPLASILQNVRRAGEDALDLISGEPDEMSERWIQSALKVPSYIFGLPGGQAGATTQFLWDWGQGDEEVDSLDDVFRGLIFGPTPQHMKNN